MPYVNVGARNAQGSRYASKKLLKEALAADPTTVHFDQTSLLRSGPDVLTGATIPFGTTLSVVGPDPYTKRNWYASVSVKHDGTLKVS